MAQPEPLLDGFLFIAFLAVATVAGVFFSRYMVHVFSGDYSHGILGTLEIRLFRFIGTSADTEEGWKGYTRDMLIFNGIGFLALFSLLLLQGYLPLNPQGFSAFNLLTAIHTAVSFVTNTNYQIYAGEVVASYLTQMAGFAVQNFLSAA
ncbi:MAG: Potassium-transporting ATPase A chain, partial [Methanomicrobiales archaeon 53_19]